MDAKIIRCDWATNHKLDEEYHDKIWGKPQHDDRELFKMLMLEGMQAGLSWSTILKKMDSMCEAFDDFNPEILITYNEAKIEGLMQNPGIIRNRLKINSAVVNAKTYFKLCEEFSSLDEYLWAYVDYKPIVNAWKTQDEVPASTELSARISKDLKKRGFKFVGTTIIYAFMQAVGMVNDHLVSCFCYPHES